MNCNQLSRRLSKGILSIIVPPKKTEIITWATTNQNPDAQIYKPKAFQRAWLQAYESPYIEKIVLSKSARVGYAIFMNTCIGWSITNDPANIMVAQNTNTDAEKYATKEAGKVFTYCAPVAKCMLGKNTSTEKAFFGGDFSVVWATSAGSFRMVTIRYLFLDEVSGWPENPDNEGDPVENAITRTETESKRKVVMGSTPKEAGTCKITKEFLLTDQRYLYVPCPHCGEMQRLKLENLRYKKDDFKSAHFVCVGCSKKIYEHHKFNMVESGEWRATREFTCCETHQAPAQWDETGTALCCKCNKPGDVNERGKVDAGFHIWMAYNDNPNTALPTLAKEYEKAKKDSLKMQSFMNTKVGVEFSTTQKIHKLNNFDALYERREYYDPLDRLPAGGWCVLASVDTQKNRFEYHTWLMGSRGEMWGLDYQVVMGDPEDESTQKELIERLSTRYRLDDGRELCVYRVVMDCNGHAWKAMLQFVAPYAGWIFAIRGEANGKNKFKPELTLTHKTHAEAHCEYRSLNVHQLKNRAAERLNNELPGKNYIHFPVSDTFDLNYFQMLTAEELVGSGSNVKWSKKAGQQRNEPWDLIVYVLWLYDFLRLEIQAATPQYPLGLVDLSANVAPIADEQDGYSDNYELSDYEAY